MIFTRCYGITRVHDPFIWRDGREGARGYRGRGSGRGASDRSSTTGHRSAAVGWTDPPPTVGRDAPDRSSATGHRSATRCVPQRSIEHGSSAIPTLTTTPPTSQTSHRAADITAAAHLLTSHSRPAAPAGGSDTALTLTRSGLQPLQPTAPRPVSEAPDPSL